MSTESREAHFHDDWAESVDPAEIDVREAWRGIGCPEIVWIAERLGDVSGKRVLDLGTGFGEAAVEFARRGAEVTAVDISPGMLELTQDIARRHGQTLTTVEASATDLSKFADASFDIVYAANVLHHVDIAPCIDEVRRVLVPGGRAGFFDPVAYNPAIQVYRRLAGDVRTDDEHPLRRRDLKVISKRFAHVQTKGFWLSALLIFVRFFAIDRLNPAKNRYWRLVIERQDKHQRFLRTTHRIDAGILRVVPPMRWMCWNLAIVAEKEPSSSGSASGGIA